MEESSSNSSFQSAYKRPQTTKQSTRKIRFDEEVSPIKTASNFYKRMPSKKFSRSNSKVYTESKTPKNVKLIEEKLVEDSFEDFDREKRMMQNLKNKKNLRMIIVQCSDMLLKENTTAAKDELVKGCRGFNQYL